MAMGPRLKPSVLRELHGRTSHGKKLPAGEPVPNGELSADDPPEWLTDEQKAGWAFALSNCPPGMLRKIDTAMLTIWVCAEAIHRTAAEQLALTPSLLLRSPAPPKTPENPNPYQPPPYPSPYLGILNKQAGIMRQVCAELGFSPAARPRLAGIQAAPLLAGLPKGRAKVPLREYLANAPTRGLMS